MSSQSTEAVQPMEILGLTVARDRHRSRGAHGRCLYPGLVGIRLGLAGGARSHFGRPEADPGSAALHGSTAHDLDRGSRSDSHGRSRREMGRPRSRPGISPRLGRARDSRPAWNLGDLRGGDPVRGRAQRAGLGRSLQPHGTCSPPVSCRVSWRRPRASGVLPSPWSTNGARGPRYVHRWPGSRSSAPRSHWQRWSWSASSTLTDLGLAGLLVPGLLAGFGLSFWVAPHLDRRYIRPAVLVFAAASAVSILIRDVF